MKEEGVSGNNIVLAVIVNCYNYENYVQKAIESVISQNDDRCELIVVDDGSTDRSWQKIIHFQVKAFKKNNGGQVSACRYGVSKTSAPFVMFLDADDELMPNAISRVISNLDISVAKLQFPLLRIDSRGAIIGSAFPNLSNFRDRESVVEEVKTAGAYLSPPTSGNVFRRDLCELLNDAQYDSAVDGVMLLAAPFFGDVVSLREPLGYYRVHGRNKSRAQQLTLVLLLRNQQERFVNRVEHLKSFLAERDDAYDIGNPKEMYIYLRYENYCDILENRRLTPRKILSSIRSIPMWYSKSKRLAVMAFLCASLVIHKSTIALIIEARLTGMRGRLRSIKSGSYWVPGW